MDNMLYIIVGLVIIAGIAFVVMRGKNKPSQSQTPASHQPSNTANQRAHSAKPAAPEPVTKFDNETVAQRFIDQQRYDKAVETIDRGLAANPADSALLLKLLHVYIATEQTDAFYQTYAKLERHADPVTMVQAQQLKAEVDREHAPMDTVPTTASPSVAAVEDAPSFSDFNFEVEEDAPAAPKANTQPAPSAPVTQTETTPTAAPAATQEDDAAFDLFLDDTDKSETATTPTASSPAQPAAQTTQAPAHASSEPEDDFSFTLDGLEASLDDEKTSTPVQSAPETATQEDAPAPVAAEPEPAAAPRTPDAPVETPATASDEDFNFDFDANDTAPTAEPSAPADEALTDARSDEHAETADDDFTLDFESLLNDTTDNTPVSTEAADANESSVEDDITLAAQPSIDADLPIDVDPTQTEDITPAVVDTAPADVQQDNTNDEFADFNLFETQDAPVTETQAFTELSLDDISAEDDNALVLDTKDAGNHEASIDFGIVDTPVVEESTSEALNIEDNRAPVANQTPESESDDAALLFDDDFDFDAFESATLGTPVADETAPVEDAPATQTAPADTSLLPPTDDEFNFVRNLDSNQVTLELAEQYLSIGEYDSAKHLLNEVLAQGNSEQQQQAHTLLARTA